MLEGGSGRSPTLQDDNDVGVSEMQGPFLSPQQLVSDKYRAVPFKQLVPFKVSEKLPFVPPFCPHLTDAEKTERTSDVLKQLGFAGVTRSSEDLQMCPPGQSPGSAWGRPCPHLLCGSCWGGHTCSHCPPPQGQAEEDWCLHTSFTRNLLASGAVTAAQGWLRCPLQAVIRVQQGPAAEHLDAHDAGCHVCHFSPQVPPDHCRPAVSAV